MEKSFYAELIAGLRKRRHSKEAIAKLKRKLAKKYGMERFPTDIEIFLNAGPSDMKYLKQLQTKPTRSLSGVAVVAVMTRPIKCPHGRCTICPGGPGSVFGDMPQSYTGKEPATMRAIRAGFDPYLQVFNRLEQYIVSGHVPDKVELIIMGGTFPSFSKDYQEEFVKYCFKAMNDFSGMFFSGDRLDILKFKEFFELPGEVGSKERTESVQGKLMKMKDVDLSNLDSSKIEGILFSKTPPLRRLSVCFADLADHPGGGIPRSASAAVAFGEAGVAPYGMPSRANRAKRDLTVEPPPAALSLRTATKISLEKEHQKNETAKIKCIGMTIETRPDYATLEHANEMLRLGCTRIELGVQSVHDDVLERIERGHKVEDSVRATEVLKDLGFKINYHYMLGLPGSNATKDLIGLSRLFVDPNFKPDMLKIYPCMVVRGTKLYEEWKNRRFIPLATADAAEIIIDFKRKVPSYVRIMRVQRDIPTYMTEAGVDRTNLRQLIQEEMKRRGIKCGCIRCREIGRAGKMAGKTKTDILVYNASRGVEFFISENKGNALLGFCRLRIPHRPLRKEITRDSAIVRELHVYGEAAAIGGAEGREVKGKIQHKGIGRKLLKKAEQIAKHNKMKKMAVISGVGARGYYKKLGYGLEGVYMVKGL